MQKIYLLLRNNKQTGPYSLEEIITSGLKSYDLIWVEGRSAGWRYPSEIDSLKPYLPEQAGIPEIKSPEPVLSQAASYPIATPIEATLKTSGNHIFVSMPSDVKQRIVEKPIEINTYQDIPSTPPAYHSYEPVCNQPTVPTDPISETRYNRSLNEIEQDYTNWVFKSKKKKSSVPLNQQTVVFGAIGVLVCALVYFGISKLVSTNNNVATQAAKNIEAKPVETKSIPSNSTVGQVAEKPETKETVSIPAATNSNQENVPSTPLKNERVIEAGNHKTYSNHTGKKSTQIPVVVKRSSDKVNQNSTSTALKQPEEIKSQQSIGQIQRSTKVEAKKKGFSAFLNGVFGKLKKRIISQHQLMKMK